MFNQKTVAATKRLHERDLLANENVVGVGVGYREVGGRKTSELCIVVSVVKKGTFRAKDRIPGILGSVPTDVQETGIFRALRLGEHRPAPGGVSIGHPRVTAGTLGCLVFRDGEVFILSNNHVMADSNLGKKGDPIIQPGSYDGGTVEESKIATLEDYVPVKFLLEQLPECPTAKAVAAIGNKLAKLVGNRHRLRAFQDDPLQMNIVDAAIARPLSPDLVTPEILEIGFPLATVVGELGMPVKKSGRTTGLTLGTITQVDVTIQVMYGEDIALFTDQLQADLPCNGGDSGSAVLRGWDLVGLLFAGSEDRKIAIVNRFENVVAELGLDEELP